MGGKSWNNVWNTTSLFWTFGNLKAVPVEACALWFSVQCLPDNLMHGFTKKNSWYHDTRNYVLLPDVPSPWMLKLEHGSLVALPWYDIFGWVIEFHEIVIFCLPICICSNLLPHRLRWTQNWLLLPAAVAWIPHDPLLSCREEKLWACKLLFYQPLVSFAMYHVSVNVRH